MIQELQFVQVKPKNLTVRELLMEIIKLFEDFSNYHLGTYQIYQLGEPQA